MHRISDPRLGGVSRKNLKMFKELCGDDTLCNVRIVTTYWDRVGEEGAQREAALRDGAFKTLVDGGARLVRHDNEILSARSIIQELIQKESVATRIQKELQDGRALGATSAGAVVFQETKQQMEDTLAELGDLEPQMKEAIRTQDEPRIAVLKKDCRRLLNKVEILTKDHQTLLLCGAGALCGGVFLAGGIAIATGAVAVEVPTALLAASELVLTAAAAIASRILSNA